MPNGMPRRYEGHPGASKEKIARREASVAEQQAAPQPLHERIREGISSAAKTAYGAIAGHNPPIPKFGKASTRSGKMDVPRHLKGRGLISAKALAAMGKAQAEAAQPEKGQHKPKHAGHAKPGMSPTGKHGATAAKPPHGQRHPPAAKPPRGKHIAQQAPGDIV